MVACDKLYIINLLYFVFVEYSLLIFAHPLMHYTLKIYFEL